MNVAWNKILQLPDSAYTGGVRITKAKLIQQAELSKTEQKELDKIRRLEHFATVAKATTRIPSYLDEERDIRGFIYLRCELSRDCGFSELASVLHKAFAWPSAILFEEPGGKIGLSVSLKRKSMAEKGATVVDRSEATKLFSPTDLSHKDYLADLAFESLPQSDLLTYAIALCDKTAKASAIAIIGEYPNCEDYLIPKLMVLLGNVKDTQAEINALKLRHRDKGATLAESSRVRMELRRKEREKDALVAEIKELCHG